MEFRTIDKKSILKRLETNFKKLSNSHHYINEAVRSLQQILQSNLQSTFISFNGGKDATIVLVLTYLALLNIKNDSLLKNQQCTENVKLPKGIYFQEPSPFPEMINFYEDMKSTFNLQMHILNSKKYASELMNFSKKYKLNYIIMGSRNDDPYCEHLDFITQSDVQKGYPSFKRVNPIIRWNYEQVWQAIKILEIPYCVLYEQGYTSLGNMDNTIKNPTLLCGDKCVSPFQANPQTQRICRVSDKR